MEGAIGVLGPTVLVTVQDIEPFHRPTADDSADIGPGFVESPAAIRQHTAENDDMDTIIALSSDNSFIFGN